jgi:hypothetical protein
MYSATTRRWCVIKPEQQARATFAGHKEPVNCGDNIT